jgi:hypothetical protein
MKRVILDRTVDLIAMWMDGFFAIDFQQNQHLLNEMEVLIESSFKLYDVNKSKLLLTLLHNPNVEFSLFVSNSKLGEKKFGKDKIGTIKRKILNNNNNSSYQQQLQQSELKAAAAVSRRMGKQALSKSKSIEFLHNEHELNSTLSLSKKQDFFVFDYSIDLIASQLTLLEWDNFLDIHVCHCLNSKAQGVNSDSRQPIDPSNINSQSCLFVDNYLSKSVYKMYIFALFLA